MVKRLPRLRPDRYLVIQPPAALAHRAGPNKITVIPNGVDERFNPQARSLLAGPYVLVVGTRIARKNTSALNEAARRLNALGIELVHAGSGRGYMRAEVNGSLRELG